MTMIYPVSELYFALQLHCQVTQKCDTIPHTHSTYTADINERLINLFPDAHIGQAYGEFSVMVRSQS